MKDKMTLVSIEGVDGSGKTTLVDALVRHLGLRRLPRVHEFWNAPTERSAIAEWLKTEHPDVITREHALAYRRIEALASHLEFASVRDRGYLTLAAGCVSMYVTRLAISTQDAQARFQAMCAEAGYLPVQNDYRVVLVPGTDNIHDVTSFVSERTREVLSSSYRQYLTHLARLLSAQALADSRTILIDCTNSREYVLHAAISALTPTICPAQ